MKRAPSGPAVTPRDPRRESGRGLALVVLIPALDEEASIGDVVARVPRALTGVRSVEVVVVDDGSTDATAERAREAGARVVSHERNRGLGAALQTGLAEARRLRADIVVNIDGDGQFAPEDITRVAEPIVSGRADFVTASRFKDPALVPVMPRAKLLGNRAMSWLVSWLVGRRFADVSCGFRAYSREALLRLMLQGRFTYTQETFLQLSFKDLRIEEVPVRVRGTREHGVSRVASSLPTYAWRTSGILFRSFRDYRPDALFNSAYAVLLALALAFGGFFLGHRIVAGTFSPHIWSGFVAAFFFTIALGAFLAGQLASMLNRIRALHEEQLYLIRLQAWRDEDEDASE